MKMYDGYFSSDSLSRSMKYFFGKDGVIAHIKDRMLWYLCPRVGIVMPFPTHVDIETSNKCQLHCPMCARRMMSESEGLMDISLFKRIVDECVAHGAYSIKLSWRGEPLLHPDVFTMVRYAKAQGMKDVAFLTNLERLDDTMARELVECGVDWISVSIDGMEKNYNTIRYPSKFVDIVKKIKTINSIKERLGRRKPMVRIQSIWSAVKNDVFEYKKFWTPLVDKIHFIADQKRYDKKSGISINPSFQCPAPWIRMFIGWDGKVANCQIDYSETNVLGDVTKQSIKEIWHGRKYAELRNRHKNGTFTHVEPCASCYRRGIMRTERVTNGHESVVIKSYVGQAFMKEE